VGPAFGASLEVGGIPAVVEMDMSPVQFDHAGGEPVEEVAVVGHQDQAAPERLQPVLKPGHRAEVEVVGGLVEDQEFRRLGQHPGQRHPLGLAARQLGHVGAGGGAHAQPLQGGPGLPSLPDRLGHRARWEVGALIEEADPGTPTPPDLSAVGRVDPTDDPQQGGFAGAVDAHHADPVPVRDGEREVLEQDPVGPADHDVLEIDEHGHEAVRLTVPAPA